MISTSKATGWSTAGAVIGVAVVAAVISHEHAHALVHVHSKTGWNVPGYRRPCRPDPFPGRFFVAWHLTTVETSHLPGSKSESDRADSPLRNRCLGTLDGEYGE